MDTSEAQLTWIQSRDTWSQHEKDVASRAVRKLPHEVQRQIATKMYADHLAVVDQQRIAQLRVAGAHAEVHSLNRYSIEDLRYCAKEAGFQEPKFSVFSMHALPTARDKQHLYLLFHPPHITLSDRLIYNKVSAQELAVQAQAPSTDTDPLHPFAETFIHVSGTAKLRLSDRRLQKLLSTLAAREQSLTPVSQLRLAWTKPNIVGVLMAHPVSAGLYRHKVMTRGLSVTERRLQLQHESDALGKTEHYKVTVSPSPSQNRVLTDLVSTHNNEFVISRQPFVALYAGPQWRYRLAEDADGAGFRATAHVRWNNADGTCTAGTKAIDVAPIVQSPGKMMLFLIHTSEDVSVRLALYREMLQLVEGTKRTGEQAD